MMKVFARGLAGVLVGIGLCGSVDAADYDVAAYVWPAYQPELRWAELGIFKKGIGEWQNVQEAVPKWAGHVQPLKPLWGYEGCLGTGPEKTSFSRRFCRGLRK